MLTCFCVENFKTFQKRLQFDLSNPGNYEFNLEAIDRDENAVSKAIIYGFNGCGKSCLGLAIFDIILHLTDKEKKLSDYEPYLNLYNSMREPARFEYHFRFNDSEVVYIYKKIGLNTLLEESLSINGKERIKYNFVKHEGKAELEGAQTLKISVGYNQISRVKYVFSNAILAKNKENEAFLSFMHFVDNMLMFYSLDSRGYRGFRTGSDNIAEAIINAGKLSEFERFLKSSNIQLSLEEGEKNGQKTIMVRFGKTLVDFFSIASTGTNSLALFYYWYILLEKASFVYIDEFDAFYHYELAETIVNYLKKLKRTQVILTTHNTDLLSNDILRPDCYYWLNNGEIHSLNRLTEKELRKAHNLQKMFKADAFYE